jgi:predicted  nucleic acid-binding Zn-ribbon protein
VRKDYKAKVTAAQKRANASLGIATVDVQDIRRQKAGIEKKLETLRKRGSISTTHVQARRDLERRNELESQLSSLNLTDAAWMCPTNAAHSFFKMKVEMP